jgi:hypothetical protein
VSTSRAAVSNDAASDAPKSPHLAWADLARDLAGPFDLSIQRSAEIQHYRMQTQFIHFRFDGTSETTETYRLRLRCTPGALTGQTLDEYACREFVVQLGTGKRTTLPALQGLSYRFDQMSGVLHPGPFFGIPQGPFEGLVASSGTRLAPDICYAIYNNFVDFHALADVFSRPMPFVQGIEQLRVLGDRIVHPGAFHEAPVSLSGVVRPGSVFRNGELSLSLNGIGLVDGRPCALVRYDSGESRLRMAFVHGDQEDVMMEGGSEYRGDLYVDLESGWVRKVSLDESVVTETHTESRPEKVPGYTARHLLVRWISPQEYTSPVTID